VFHFSIASASVAIVVMANNHSVNTGKTSKQGLFYFCDKTFTRHAEADIKRPGYVRIEYYICRNVMKLCNHQDCSIDISKQLDIAQHHLGYHGHFQYTYTFQRDEVLPKQHVDLHHKHPAHGFVSNDYTFTWLPVTPDHAFFF
jgi:hypothetical protein